MQIVQVTEQWAKHSFYWPFEGAAKAMHSQGLVDLKMVMSIKNAILIGLNFRILLSRIGNWLTHFNGVSVVH